MEIICSDQEDKQIRLMDLKPGDLFKLPLNSGVFMLLRPISFMKDINITYNRNDRLCVDLSRKKVSIVNATEDVIPYHGLLEIWKKGGIDDRVLIALFDLKKVERKPWYRIYCGELISKLKKIRTEMEQNVELVSYIESELLKFKQNINH